MHDLPVKSAGVIAKAMVHQRYQSNAMSVGEFINSWLNKAKVAYLKYIQELENIQTVCSAALEFGHAAKSEASLLRPETWTEEGTDGT